MSFRFGRIEIRRSSWYRASLSSLRGWSTAGRLPGDYSNGRADNNPGAFALVPTAFILVRDVKISASWGSSDLHAAAQATSASTNVGWGPFSLSGSYSNSSSSRRFKSSFDGITITVPGASIVGWMSTVQPFSPPADGPPSVRGERRILEVATQRRRNPYAESYIAAPAGSSELDSNGATRVQEDDPARSSVPSETTPFPESLVSEFASAESATEETETPPVDTYSSEFVSAES